MSKLQEYDIRVRSMKLEIPAMLDSRLKSFLTIAGINIHKAKQNISEEYEFHYKSRYIGSLSTATQSTAASLCSSTL